MNEEGERIISLEETIRSATKEQLEEIILAHCREDGGFRLQVVRELAASPEEELKTLKKLVENALKNGADDCGEYDGRGIGMVAGAVHEAVCTAAERMEAGNLKEAFGLITDIYDTLAEVLEATDQDDAVEAMFAEVATAQAGLSAKIPADKSRAQWVRRILDLAKTSNPEIGLRVLAASTALVDASNKEAFTDVANTLRAEDPSAAELAHTVLSQIILLVEGDKAAETYLRLNRNIESFRLALLRGALDRRDYADAEILCMEPLIETSTTDQEKAAWAERLRSVYADEIEKPGPAQKQEAQTPADRSAVLKPQTLHEMVIARERQLTLEAFLDAMVTSPEKDLLAGALRRHPAYVWTHGAAALPEHHDDIVEIASGEILAETERAGNRKEYRHLGERLHRFAILVGRPSGEQLIDRICRENQRRPALVDELERARTQLPYS